MHQSPFAGMPMPKIYEGLITGAFGPRWPDEKLQASYSGMNGPGLAKRAFDFLDILERDGAFKPGWKGLDYGCGWGRFLSTGLSKGSSEQLDGCDAWQRTLNLLSELNYPNDIFKVSELLEDGEIRTSTYDLILSFSVFTHLCPRAFDQNIPALLKGLKPGGNLYITVRHDEFIDHKYKNLADELRANLDRDGIVFLDSGGDLTGEKIFGDTIVARDYLSRYGSAHISGSPMRSNTFTRFLKKDHVDGTG